MSSQSRTGFRVTLFASILAISIAMTAVLQAYPDGPPPAANGGLSGSTCSQFACHSGSVNNPNSKSTITLTNFPTSYTAGQTYTLTIKVGLINPVDQTSPQRRRYGFQLSARFLDDGTQAGTFTLPNSNVGFDVQDGRATVSFPNPIEGILYVSHSNQSSSTCINNPSCTWTVNWVAPSAATGRVEFDVGGNSADGNNDPSNDFILQKTVFSDPAAPPPAPQFASSNPVSPSTGNTNGGIVVTINGSNFVNGSAVNFGVAAAATTFVSPTQLTAVLPARTTAGVVDVKVQNPDAQSATLVGGFTYTLAPPPQFASSNPTTPHISPTDGGTLVTINGAGFISGSTVRFGSTPAGSTQFVSATQLKAVSPPASLPGAVDLIVRNVDGQTATLSGSFTYFDNGLKVAYAVATSANSKSAEESALSLAPAGGGVFSFSQNNVLVTTAGTASAAPARSMLLFADSKPFASVNGALTNNTGVAIINQSGAVANLTFTLLKPDGTLALASPPPTPLANGFHLQGFITDSNFFGSAANNFTGTLKIESDQPVSALSLQLTNNQAPRSDTLLTSTPVADLNQPAPSGNLVFSQLADGSGYQSRIVLLDTTNAAISGKIFFFKDDGAPASFDFGTGSAVTELAYAIQPHSEFSALSTGLGNLRVGFALVVPDAGKATPVGTGMFVLTQSGFTVTTVGVPSSPATTAGLILSDTNPTAKGLAQNTGLALANPSDTLSVNVTFKLRPLSGGTPIAKSIRDFLPVQTTIPPHGHTALFVDQLFTGGQASNFTGTLSIESDNPVAALTLLQTTNQRGDVLFTTLPVATASSSTGPVFFPQLVSGGGYETQIVLLNPALAAISGLLSFFSGADISNGTPVLLPLNDSVSGSFQYSISPNGGATFK